MANENTKEEVKKEEEKKAENKEVVVKETSTKEKVEAVKKDTSKEIKEKKDKSEEASSKKVEVKKESDSKEKKKKVKSKKKEQVVAPAYLADLNFYPELRKDLAQIHTGDIIDLSYRIVEGGKEKVQHYKGTVIALKGTGISRTITVRKMSFGIAVERIFPLNSKFVKEIKIDRRSKVRRSKLYFLRKLRGKASRLKPLK